MTIFSLITELLFLCYSCLRCLARLPGMDGWKNRKGKKKKERKEEETLKIGPMLCTYSTLRGSTVLLNKLCTNYSIMTHISHATIETRKWQDLDCMIRELITF